MLSDQIAALELRHADVTLKGQLVNADGVRVAFETSESFKAESRGWRQDILGGAVRHPNQVNRMKRFTFEGVRATLREPRTQHG